MSSDVRDHIPDMSQYEGLRDILALGMILEFSTVIDRRKYTTTMAVDADTEEEARLEKSTRRYFRVLFKTFCTNYATNVGSEWIHPSYVYKLSLVKFAVALLEYMKNIVADPRHIHIATEQDILIAIQDYFKEDHPDLCPALEHYREKGKGWLIWSGPSIEIFRRGTGNEHWGEHGDELCQLASDPIYF